MTERVLNSDEVLLRLDRIRDEVSRAVLESGRTGDAVRLMAVTKTRTPELINAVIDRGGITLLGENRAQELLEKYNAYHKDEVNIHFIGHLQTNKVKQIVDKVSLIESVDSLRLAEEISKESIKLGKTMEIFIEVNIGEENSKSGILKEQLPDLLHEVATLEGIKVRGLMTIPPICDKKSEIEQYFSNMYKLFIDIKHKKIDNVSMDFLSMGMSGDYIEAIKHGSNIIRLGSAIFGQRLI